MEWEGVGMGAAAHKVANHSLPSPTEAEWHLWFVLRQKANQ